MNNNIWTITQLNHYIKGRLDQDLYLKGIYVEGEVSNLNLHPSGHWYFTLKDNSSRLSCVMFSSYASKSKLIPTNGMKILVKGSISVFETTGQYQLYAVELRPTGLGDLALKLEQLKNKLQLLGYFEVEHRIPIPSYPDKIGVICGENTAAYQDVIRTLTRRWPIAKIYPFFSLVQGKEASTDIVKALAKADKANLDIIILARGGGSLEDLWCFNEENVVKAVYECTTPIITGIGHESDTTLVDYVADLRASTPTAAAEHATPDILEVRELLKQDKDRLVQAGQQLLRKPTLELDLRYEKLLKFTNNVHQKQDLLQISYQKLVKSTKIYAQNVRISFNQNNSRFQNETKNLLVKYQSKQKIFPSKLLEVMNNYYKLKVEEASRISGLLDAYSPLKILSRGYGVISDIDNKVITSVNQINQGDFLQIRLSDGQLKAQISERKLYAKRK